MPRVGLEPNAGFVDEDHCELCGGIPPGEREAFRANLDRIRLHGDDETICKACFVAFWRNLGLPVSDEDPPEDQGRPRKLILVRRNKVNDDNPGL
jgi:hypothetical protein